MTILEKYWKKNSWLWISQDKYRLVKLEARNDKII